jgi:phospholipid transport system substrate-binding protein
MKQTKVLVKQIVKSSKLQIIRNGNENCRYYRGWKYTLGSHRKKLNDDQTQEYFFLFEKYFLKIFTERLTDYSEPKIEVLSAEVVNPKYTIVKSLLLATIKNQKSKLTGEFTQNPDKPLIRDLIIEGLSLARAEKEQFNSIINSNNGDSYKIICVVKRIHK